MAYGNTGARAVKVRGLQASPAAPGMQHGHAMTGRLSDLEWMARLGAGCGEGEKPLRPGRPEDQWEQRGYDVLLPREARTSVVSLKDQRVLESSSRHSCSALFSS